MTRVLGLDLGAKRIGVALSDPTGTVASPLTTLEHRSRQDDVRRIAALCVEHAVSEVVVGWPRNMDGTSGPAARRAAGFAERLRRALGVPVALIDERLSTAAAERALIGAGVRREARRGVRDRVAAAVILQGYLDGRGARGTAASRSPAEP